MSAASPRSSATRYAADPARRRGGLAGQLRIFLAGPKPFLERAASLQRILAKRFTVEAMTRDVVDFHISELGVVPRRTGVSNAGVIRSGNHPNHWSMACLSPLWVRAACAAWRPRPSPS